MTCEEPSDRMYRRARVALLARVAVGEMWPDEIVIFDVDVDTAWKRMAAGRANAAPDRMEL
jgi:thymidylate kinase